MNESYRKYMRLGTILHVSYKEVGAHPDRLLECLKKIVTDPMFELVEITHIEDPKTRKKAAAMIEQSGMACAFGGQGLLLSEGLNINDVNESGRQRALEVLKKGIDEAYEMRAEDFQFLAGRYAIGFEEQYFGKLLESTEELCRYARSKGRMPVLCEVFDYDIAKKVLVGPASMAKRYAATICEKYDNFGLLVDSSHIPLLHETIEESVLPVRHYIRHAHIGNAVMRALSLPAYGDEHPRFGFPNSENTLKDLVDYLRVLHEIGFLNTEKRPLVSFEIKPFEDEDPDIILANAKRIFELAWALV